jgi:hypothetical protein
MVAKINLGPTVDIDARSMGGSPEDEHPRQYQMERHPRGGYTSIRDARVGGPAHKF